MRSHPVSVIALLLFALHVCTPQTCSQGILGSVPTLAARVGDCHDKHKAVVFDTERGFLYGPLVMGLTTDKVQLLYMGTLFFPLHLGLKESLPTSDKSHFTPKQIGPRKIFVMIS